ncbi:MAG: acetylxylan esterase [Planctomycetota bacterium]
MVRLFSIFVLFLVVSNSNVLRGQTLDSYFESRVNAIEQATSQDFAAVTKENWPATKAVWRGELREMLGIPEELEKTELKVQSTGRLELEGVTVEKLHYQSRPGLYVAANLYLPKTAAPKSGYPAVLYVCGHARSTNFGRLMGNKTGYQHHGLWFARHGFVCLMIDTVQLGEFHGEHHGTYKLGRWDWMTKGYTPAGVEAWNAIRGVDLLNELPYVDATKIGITGRSGGGAYSWFAAALDERIQVAIPVAGITDLRNHVVDGCVEGHCDCMYFVNYFGWDYGKLAALIAPRPLLLENSDSDRIFPLDGVVRIDGQLRELYAKLEASENYGLVITPGPHKDTQDLRVPAFRFLMKHLQGNNDPIVDTPSLKRMNQLALKTSYVVVVGPMTCPHQQLKNVFKKLKACTNFGELYVGRRELMNQMHPRSSHPKKVNDADAGIGFRATRCSPSGPSKARSLLG